MHPQLRDEYRLALAFAPRDARAPLAALFAFDELIERVVRTSREPMLGQLKLAWWREELGKRGRAALSEVPGLELLWTVSGDAGTSLVAIIDGWEELLAPLPLTADALLHFSNERGQAVFALTAQILEAPVEARLGTRWALGDLAQQSRDAATAALSRRLAAEQPEFRSRPPRALRVLLALASDHATKAARAKALLRATLG